MFRQIVDLLAAPSWQAYKAAPSRVLFEDFKTKEKSLEVMLYCAETCEAARATREVMKAVFIVEYLGFVLEKRMIGLVP